MQIMAVVTTVLTPPLLHHVYVKHLANGVLPGYLAGGKSSRVILSNEHAQESHGHGDSAARDASGHGVTDDNYYDRHGDNASGSGHQRTRSNSALTHDTATGPGPNHDFVGEHPDPDLFKFYLYLYSTDSDALLFYESS